MTFSIYDKMYKVVYRKDGQLIQDIYRGWGNAMARRKELLRQGYNPALKFA